jgi:hypothetical protein
MTRSTVAQTTLRSIVKDCSETADLHRKFGALVQELKEIDQDLQSGSMIDIAAGTNFSDPSAAERMAIIYAIDAVQSFLASEGAWCKVLFRLSHDLQQLRFGVASGSLTAVKPRAGRKGDAPAVSELKGRVAGIARLLIESGQSRNDAAAWIARKIPDRLADRLSSKPIEASTVKEWMDQYDCGANILDVFASEEKQREFESCFATPTEVDGAEEEDAIDRTVRLWAFLREHVPEHKKQKRRNSISGMKGFMIEIYIGSLFGYRPNFDHLFADLEELVNARRFRSG